MYAGWAKSAVTFFQVCTRLPADDVKAIVRPSLLTVWFCESQKNKYEPPWNALVGSRFCCADPAAWLGASHFRLTRRFVPESTSLVNTSREKLVSVVPVTMSPDVRRVL